MVIIPQTAKRLWQWWQIGPGQLTGKVSASPEIMAYLDMKDGAQRGPAILFFVDDRDNSIALGPVERRNK